jgi:hypothetical protein
VCPGGIVDPIATAGAPAALELSQFAQKVGNIQHHEQAGIHGALPRRNSSG